MFGFEQTPCREVAVFGHSTANGEVVNCFLQLNRLLLHRLDLALKAVTHASNYAGRHLLGAGDNQFHSAVCEVPDKTSNWMLGGNPARRPAKADSLNKSCEQDLFRYLW